MPTPFYADIGKRANGVFTKGYHFGVYKLDVKTKSETGAEFATGFIANHETKNVFGSIQSKFGFKDYGLSFTEKWNTDNVLGTDLTMSIIPGLNVTFEGTFAPHTGAKTAKMKNSYTNDLFAVNSNLDLNIANPIVDVAAVINLNGRLFGVNGQYDPQSAKFTKNNVALGYHSPSFDLYTYVNNGKEFGSSIYQKVSEKVDCGITMKWVAGSLDTLFGVGTQVTLDENTTVHFKVDNKVIFGFGYQQKLRPGTTLTLSAAVDGQKLKEGGYKVGAAIELQL